MPQKKSSETLEIVVAKYWPTKIIKTVQVTVPGKDKWRNEITLSREEAKYLYEQLKPLVGKDDVEPKPPRQEANPTPTIKKP